MKKLFIVVFAVAISVSVNAQLKVQSNGETYINQNGNASVSTGLTVRGRFTGIKSYKIVNDTTAWGGGVYGCAYPNHAGFPYGVMGEVESPGPEETYGFCYGVLGRSYGSFRGKNYGVYGELPHYTYGAGVYGSIYYMDVNDPLSYYQGYDLYGYRYAGFFAGPVKVTYGQLEATLVSPLSPQNVLPTDRSGDATNTQSMTERLGSLSTVCYEKAEPVLRCGTDSDNVIVRGYNNTKRKHYTLTAEELETYFPEFVYENENGEKSVSYVEMVPILIQSINELSRELSAVRNELSVIKETASEDVRAKIVSGLNDVQNSEHAGMKQNIPNPWSVTTRIEANIPHTVSKAVVGFYDLTGKEVKTIDISERGKTVIQLKSYDFVPGIYIYTLITDGQVVESKRMLLTK